MPARPRLSLPSSPAERSEGKGIQGPSDGAFPLDPLPSAQSIALWASPGVTGGERGSVRRQQRPQSVSWAADQASATSAPVANQTFGKVRMKAMSSRIRAMRLGRPPTCGWKIMSKSPPHL